jgi:hypothetical protein
MSTPTQALALRVIEWACRAPSVHNSQPWRWRLVDAATIELHADRRRQLRLSDPGGRNLAISCGTALHHGYVAAQALGLSPAVEHLPLPGDKDLLARIRLSPGTPTVEARASLQDLERRGTDRRRFTSWPVPDSRLTHLAKAASGWGAHALPISDVTTRFRAEQLLERAMEVQASDPRFAEEQRQWTHNNRQDGLPMANAAPLGHDRLPSRPNRFAQAGDPVTRTTTGNATTGNDTSAPGLESSDGLMAICSSTDDVLAWLKTGEALSALWLQATHDGLSIVPLSQAVEVDETRQALHHDVFDGMALPQVLLRVGWLEVTRPPMARTPRRPVDEVMER